MILESNVAANLRGTAADMLESKGTAVHSIGPRDTVYDAIAKMTEFRVGALPVMDGEALVGIVSERDYRSKVILMGRASKETLVEEIMTAQVLTVGPEATLKECLEFVTEQGVRHMPVTKDGRVVGILSIGDLVRAIVAQQAETIQSLSSIIGSDYPT